FLLTNEECNEFLEIEPLSKKYIKRFVSAKEFLNNEKRWVIWLVDADPSDLKKLPNIMERVEAVKQFRLASKARSTRDYPYHTLFRQVTQPMSDYVLIPRVTSERRSYIPMGFFSKDDIVSDACQAIPDATLYHFG